MFGTGSKETQRFTAGEGMNFLRFIFFENFVAMLELNVLSYNVTIKR